MLFQLLLRKVSKGEVFRVYRKLITWGTVAKGLLVSRWIVVYPVDSAIQRLNKGARLVFEIRSKVNPRLRTFYTSHPVGNLMGTVTDRLSAATRISAAPLTGKWNKRRGAYSIIYGKHIIIGECSEMERREWEKAEEWELAVISSSLLSASPPLPERLEQA